MNDDTTYVQFNSTDTTITDTSKFTRPPHLILGYEPSDWTCYLFGGSKTSSIQWVPHQGEVPCWFWRKMQWIFFGNKWVLTINVLRR